MSSIQCNALSIRNLFIDNVSSKDENKINYFSIPVFQRPYIWKYPELKQLFEDIKQFESILNSKEKTIFSNSEEEYFLGSIILCMDDNMSGKALIIDGAQRITTLTLLMREAYLITSKLYSKAWDFLEEGTSKKGQVISNNLGDFNSVIEALDSMVWIKIPTGSETNEYVPRLSTNIIENANRTMLKVILKTKNAISVDVTNPERLKEISQNLDKLDKIIKPKAKTEGENKGENEDQIEDKNIEKAYVNKLEKALNKRSKSNKDLDDDDTFNYFNNINIIRYWLNEFLEVEKLKNIISDNDIAYTESLDNKWAKIKEHIDQITSKLKCIIDKIKLVVVRTESLNQAIKAFETINGAGVALEFTDLIKNALLAPAISENLAKYKEKQSNTDKDSENLAEYKEKQSDTDEDEITEADEFDLLEKEVFKKVVEVLHKKWNNLSGICKICSKHDLVKSTRSVNFLEKMLNLYRDKKYAEKGIKDQNRPSANDFFLNKAYDIEGDKKNKEPNVKRVGDSETFIDFLIKAAEFYNFALFMRDSDEDKDKEFNERSDGYIKQEIYKKLRWLIDHSDNKLSVNTLRIAKHLDLIANLDYEAIETVFFYLIQYEKDNGIDFMSKDLSDKDKKSLIKDLDKWLGEFVGEIFFLKLVRPSSLDTLIYNVNSDILKHERDVNVWTLDIWEEYFTEDTKDHKHRKISLDAVFEQVLIRDKVKQTKELSNDLKRIILLAYAYAHEKQQKLLKNVKSLQLEHIRAKKEKQHENPKLNANFIDNLGNFILLEAKINNSIKNKPLIEKANDSEEGYAATDISVVDDLCNEIIKKDGKGFGEDWVIERKYKILKQVFNYFANLNKDIYEPLTDEKIEELKKSELEALNKVSQ